MSALPTVNPAIKGGGVKRCIRGFSGVDFDRGSGGMQVVLEAASAFCTAEKFDSAHQAQNKKEKI